MAYDEYTRVPKSHIILTKPNAILCLKYTNGFTSHDCPGFYKVSYPHA